MKNLWDIILILYMDPIHTLNVDTIDTHIIEVIIIPFIDQEDIMEDMDILTEVIVIDIPTADTDINFFYSKEKEKGNDGYFYQLHEL